MTPEQLMEIPGIGEKMVDKLYQAVNRFYEGGGEAAAVTEEGVAVEGAENSEAVVEGEQVQEEVAENSEAPAESETSADETPANNDASALPDNEAAGNADESNAESGSTHSEKLKHATAAEDAAESAQGDSEQP